VTAWDRTYLHAEKFSWAQSIQSFEADSRNCEAQLSKKLYANYKLDVVHILTINIRNIEYTFLSR
jgi:hypothetical protein